MKVLGITGSFGSGKSTVCRIFEVLGAKVIDADQIAREIVQPGLPAWSDIVEEFGEEVLNCDSTLNRKGLARIVFGDSEKLAKLNDITHPRIISKIREQVDGYRDGGEKVVLLEAALIVEKGGLKDLLSGLIVVTAERGGQIKRLVEGRGYSEREAAERIDAQMPEDEKAKHATFLIDNSSTKEQTARQVEAIWKKLLSCS